jgi:glycosyltransferase involved in cell wall biosynthesis
MHHPTRVLHFVTGGFTGGATQVAIKLVTAALHDPQIEALLVVRRKRHTDPSRIEELRQRGIRVLAVPGWSHIATVVALIRICREFRPTVLFAHGFSEHLWGRYAGWLAGVPYLVHVEHNTRERYNFWRLAQARWLARKTARIVGCSEGVRRRLLELGFPADRVMAIDNGINLEPFADAERQSFSARAPAIVMVARFARQKDHSTLLQAVALLRERGLQPMVYLAGGGRDHHRKAVQKLARELGIDAQIHCLGVVRDVPQRLIDARIAVLATHHEGMPLAIIEGMAAGCAVVGSRVPGVQEIITPEVDGLLAEPRDPRSLADALARLLQDEALAARLGATARRHALERYGLERMAKDYAALVQQLTSEKPLR